MIDNPVFNRGAQRYAGKRYRQASKLGLVQGVAPGDLAAWWREFSKNPQAWNMEQQQAAQGAQQGVMSILGERGGETPQPQLQEMLQRLMGGQQNMDVRPDRDVMRQDILTQMLHAQQAQPTNGMEGMVDVYRNAAQRLMPQGQHPLLQNLFGRKSRMNAGTKKIQAVGQASSQARQLAQLMSKRLRGV
jgi:hypothetical protein